MNKNYGLFFGISAVLVACATGSDVTDGLGDLNGSADSGGGNAADGAGGSLDTDGASVPSQQTPKGDSGLQGEADAGNTQSTDGSAGTDASTGSTDSGTTVDSSTDAGCTVVTENLLQNAGFDTGITPWVQSEADLIDSPPTGLTAQSPAYIGWMGDANNATQSLYEAVAIPANTTALHVKGYRWIATEDVAGYDILSIQTRNSGGTKLEELASLSISTSDTKWIAFDYTVPTTHAGTTIQLAFVVTTDDSLNTNFFLDTMEVDATYCKY